MAYNNSKLGKAKFAKRVGISREHLDRLLKRDALPRDTVAEKFAADSGRPKEDFLISRRREVVVAGLRAELETIFDAKLDLILSRLEQLEAAQRDLAGEIAQLRVGRSAPQRKPVSGKGP